MEFQLMVGRGSKLYIPVLEDGVSLSLERSGAPGKLEFSTLADGVLNFAEGDAVRLTAGGSNLFFGYVFTKSRDKSGFIQVTAYDQLRYLKNKDTFIYENKKASELVKLYTSGVGVVCGEIEDTGYVLEPRVEENKTIFDMIREALDITLAKTGRLYVLYDDFGRLTLKNADKLKLDILIDAETGENFDYESSIDEHTYNKIKLSYENKDSGKREVYVAQDSAKIEEWGYLQYYEKLNDPTSAAEKAKALLENYNRKTRKLSIKKAFGDVRVRAGSAPGVCLNLGDMTVNRHMLVNSVKHIFKEGEHFMDLDLIGGEFNA